MGMNLDVPLSLEPMEAAPVDDLPAANDVWQYEPKIDGFRCLIFRDGDQVHLQSKNQRPLERFFPEMVAGVKALRRKRFVLDGELVIPEAPFDALQARLHPATSRIERLSRETPAEYVAFDLLAGSTGKTLLDRPFSERRAGLEKMFATIAKGAPFSLSEATSDPKTARTWLKQLGKGIDGIVAKRLDLHYRSGARAMQKYKVWRTVDCVVGGVYCRRNAAAIEYLLMGLYDHDGILHYVGRCRAAGIPEKELATRFAPLLGRGGFTGKQPGGESRWTGDKREALPVEPEIVAEVSADHIENGRFRHGSRFVRWRPDKKAGKCTFDQFDGSH
jgi:ATP-dependent DNA ligase